MSIDFALIIKICLVLFCLAPASIIWYLIVRLTSFAWHHSRLQTLHPKGKHHG